MSIIKIVDTSSNRRDLLQKASEWEHWHDGVSDRSDFWEELRKEFMMEYHDSVRVDVELDKVLTKLGLTRNFRDGVSPDVAIAAMISLFLELTTVKN